MAFRLRRPVFERIPAAILLGDKIKTAILPFHVLCLLTSRSSTNRPFTVELQIVSAFLVLDQKLLTGSTFNDPKVFISGRLGSKTEAPLLLSQILATFTILQTPLGIDLIAPARHQKQQCK